MTVTTLQQLAQLLSGQVIAAPRETATSLCINRNSIDTRTLQRGDLFWALAGPRRDGHDYVGDAFARGARAAIVSRKAASWPGPVLQVADVQAALAALARWHRQQQDALLIGVTGSVGKTTTRHLLHHVLSSQFCGIESQQNFNNHLGVPLSLLGLNSQHEFGVIELAASAPGEIRPLAELVEPEIGVISQIGPAHLDRFGNLENVIHTKAELLSQLPETGFAVLPEQIALLPQVREQLTGRAITVGQSSDCDVCVEQVQFRSGELKFVVGRDEFRMSVPGRHFLGAALLGLGVARELGVSTDQIRGSLATFEPLPGRCQLRRMGSWSILDDTYNASPLSMTAGLDALQQLPGVSQRIAILGDMLCLGEQTRYYHRKLGQEVARGTARGTIDYLLTYGPHAQEIARGAFVSGMSNSRIGVFENLEQLQQILSLWLQPGSGILLKASRNIELERLLGWLEQEASRQTASENFVAAA